MTTQTHTDTLVQATLVAASLILASLLSMTLIHHGEPGTLANLLFALVPLPFFALSIFWLVWNAGASDERRRRIQLEAVAFAFPLSMIFAITVQLLHSAGAALQFGLGDLFVDMGLLYFIGLYLAWRRHR
jgi:hypothetical protein